MDDRKDQVESWYRNYGKNIIKWTKARSLQDAEDILQNTAISLLTNPAEWEVISRKKTHKYANSDFYNRKSKDKAHYNGAFDSLDDIMDLASSTNLTEELIARKSLELVCKILETVSDKKAAYTGFNTGNTLLKSHRDIFVMHFFQEMDYPEIAETLKMSPGTVRQLGSQAKKIIVTKFNDILNKV